MFQNFAVSARPADAPPRVAKLRAWLAEQGLDGIVVPRADAHQGEYVAPCDARLAWITGFTGSAGFAVILRDRAAVFTDGRYTVQVRTQTDPATFETVAWPGTGLADWLPGVLPDGGRIAFDPWLHTVREIEKLREMKRIDLVPSANGVDAVWDDRPDAPAGPVTAYPDKFAGRDHGEKRRAIADAITALGISAFVTNQPDAIAWLLNIRGTDIERTPLVQAFAVVHADRSVDLICNPAKVSPVLDHLGPEVRVTPPEGLADLLARLEGPVGYDPATCPVALAEAIRDATPVGDPIAIPKAVKSPAEIAATTEAHLRDGAAMVRFLRWLDEDRPEGLTEIGVTKALEGFRRETNQLRDISFETIAGSGPNGAIVHYRVNEETDRPLAGDPIILVDSGGQYIDGTTDITRTVSLTEPPDDIRHAFTRVLQGMIAVSRTKFPRGVAGCHLDALARAPLWAEHRDYDHGTGHGVGVYLGVHEGPQRLSRVSDVPLQPGMILSNEPGYYKPNAFGIRIENLVLTEERQIEGMEGRYLGFETLTFVPLDRKLIDTGLLTAEEIAWVDAYHAKVRAVLSPRLTGEDLAWLERETQPL